MYKIYNGLLFKITALIICFYSTAFCQVPNGGFENWTNGNPDGWIGDNDLADGLVPITPTADSHSGNSALKGEVIPYQGIPLNPVLGIIFPYSGRPTNFTGYCKFTSAGSDSLVILVSLGSRQDSGGVGGGGSVVIKNTVNNYAEFNIPIYWVSQNPPDSCVISFTVCPASPNAHAGTEYYIDDLSFLNNAAGVADLQNKNPNDFKLYQNFPNPFNPSTTIKYSITNVETRHPRKPGQVASSLQQAQLNIYDVLGNIVSTLVNQEEPAGAYQVAWDAANLPSGIYFYRLKVGNYTATKKLMLLK
jgi:hypothetical protein